MRTVEEHMLRDILRVLAVEAPCFGGTLHAMQVVPEASMSRQRLGHVE